MRKFVALLRAVNVGGTGKARSTDLKSAAESIGFRAVQPLLQTGNLIFEAEGHPAILEARLEGALLARLSLRTEVMVRDAAEWDTIVENNPFAAAAVSDPGHLLVMVMKEEPLADGLAALKSHPGPERIEARGRELYIVYPDGVGRSKLNKDSAWKKLGSRGTGRNWNTVLKLAAALV